MRITFSDDKTSASCHNKPKKLDELQNIVLKITLDHVNKKGLEELNSRVERSPFYCECRSIASFLLEASDKSVQG